MRTIKISIDAPYIDASSSLEHISSSYQVSKVPDFTDPALIVVDVVEDTVNLIEYRFEYDLQPNESLYVRNKYHFNTGYSSNWSKIIPVNRDQIGIKMSNNMVNTPNVNYVIDYTNDDKGIIKIETSKFSMYGGLGTHDSTTWSIIDADGEIIYNRVKDKDNLLYMEIPLTKLTYGKTYIIRARHHSDTNADSNFSKVVLALHSGTMNLYELLVPFPLVNNRDLYFELRLYTTKFSSIDIAIYDRLGNKVLEELNQTTIYPKITVVGLTVGAEYSVRAKVNLTDNIATIYRTVITTVAKENQLIDFANIAYPGNFDYMHLMLTNGKAIQASTESYSGGIFLTKNNDTNIYRYEVYNNQLVELGPVINYDTLANIFDKTYMNIVQLRNGDLLLDYAGDLSNGTYRKPTFKIYKYNHVLQTFTLDKTLHRDDERYSTAESLSLAPMVDGMVYYIPANIQDSNGVEQDLVIRKYDTINNTVSDITTLGFSLKRFVSLVDIGNNELLLLGGVNDTSVYNNELLRSNNTIYKYNITTNTLSGVYDISGIIPDDMYNLHCVRRRDNKILIMNNTAYGPSSNNQITYVYDLDTNTMVTEYTDYGNDVTYESSLVLLSGDIIRISSRVLDPQKIYNYLSHSKTDIADNTTVGVISNLVVPAGEIVTIENPYRFDSITIEGTSTTDTGLLRWIDDDQVHEFRYLDLIITRATDKTTVDITAYDSITILEGASLY